MLQLVAPKPDPVRVKPDAPKPPKYLTQSQLDSFRKATKPDPKAYALFGLMYAYGMRVSEVCALKMADVDLARARITVTRSKAGRTLEYPIPAPQMAALKSWLRHRPDVGPFLFISNKSDNQHGMNTRTVRRMFDDYATMACIEGAVLHSLRHTAAVHAIEAGISLPLVSDLLGHKSVKATAIYAQVTSKARDTMIGTLENSETVVRW